MAEELSAFAKKRKAKKIRRYVFLGILVFVLLGTCAYFALENYFVVKKVTLQETSLYPSEKILEVCGIEKETPLYKIPKNQIATAVEEEFPYLVDVQIKYDLPDTVKISFTEDFGEFSVSLGQELYAVDRDLNVLAKETKPTNIPRIRLSVGDISRCVVGEKITFIDEDTSEILTLLIETLERKKMLGDIKEINASDQFNLKLNYLDRFEVLLGDHEDFDLKLSMILAVVEDLGSETTGRIDISNPNNAYVKQNDQI